MFLQSGIYSLAPSWSTVFDKWTNLHRFQKEAIVSDLGYLNKNPVAEAYNWDCSYYNKESEKYCPECSWFGWSYSYVITGDDMNVDKEIVELKGGQFVQHWEKNHNGFGSSFSSDTGAKSKSKSKSNSNSNSNPKSPVIHMSGVHSHSASSSLISHKRAHQVKGLKQSS